jgi:hypothetical protein
MLLVVNEMTKDVEHIVIAGIPKTNDSYLMSICLRTIGGESSHG